MTRESLPDDAATRLSRVQLVDQVVAGLRAALSSGVYEAGDRLPGETSLAKSYGVGRSTIREALKVLRHLGLIETMRGSGSRVADSPEVAASSGRAGIADLRLLFELRAAVEVEVAQLAALRRSESQLASIRGALERLHETAQLNDRIALGRADTALHGAIAAASGNRYFVQVYENFAEHFSYSAGRILDMQEPERVRDVHDELVDAIAARDARAAAIASRSTFDEVLVRLNLLESQL